LRFEYQLDDLFFRANIMLQHIEARSSTNKEAHLRLLFVICLLVVSMKLCVR